MGESCFSFLQLFFCGTSSRKSGNTKVSDALKVKIRIGFDGKDTLMDPTNMNVKSTFGMFAVLLDYTTNELVPLNGAGFLVEPLDTHKRYVVVVNTHGSSQKKWEYLRGDKGGRHKHKLKKSKSKKSKHKEKDKEKGKAEELSSMASLATKDISISSSASLLNENSLPNNGDDDLWAFIKIARAMKQQFVLSGNLSMHDRRRYLYLPCAPFSISPITHADLQAYFCVDFVVHQLLYFNLCNIHYAVC